MFYKSSLAAGLVGVACLCADAAAQNIYTCVDGKGRKITADRPIAECLDRPQQELTSSGYVKRQVNPALTGQERVAQEERDKLATEERARVAEDKRRDRALLLRYSSRTVHDQERGTALAQIDEVTKAAANRAAELTEQRRAMNSEFEFYAKDPGKAPFSLKRRLQENDASMLMQKKFIADQELEKKRVNLRFDQELVKLNQLWALTGGVPANAAVIPPKVTAGN